MVLSPAKKAAERIGLDRGLHAPDRQGEIEAEQRHHRRADRSGQQHDPALRHPGRDGRADGDRHGEHRQIGRDGDFAAAERVFDHGGQDGKDDGPDQPEPGCHERSAPDAAVGAELGDQVPCRTQYVAVDDEVGRLRAGRRDVAADEPAAGRQDHHHRAEHQDAYAVGGDEAADDGAAEYGGEGGGLDPGVGAGQFLALEMVGQDAVFDRPEQRRNDAEHEQRHHQQRDRGERDAGDRDCRRDDLDELQSSGDRRLVETVGKLAAKC